MRYKSQEEHLAEWRDRISADLRRIEHLCQTYQPTAGALYYQIEGILESLVVDVATEVSGEWLDATIKEARESSQAILEIGLAGIKMAGQIHQHYREEEDH